MPEIRLAQSEGDIERCYPVMSQLRPHVPERDFVARVRRQMTGGYEMALLDDDGGVRAVAGFRVFENLVRGRHMYVDDLVTESRQRSAGHGRALLDWLVDLAKARGCAALELDSGVQRFDAHRFYFRQRMSIVSYHFTLPLE